MPTTYQGVRFRSTLEADWAATFDALGVAWQCYPLDYVWTSHYELLAATFGQGHSGFPGWMLQQFTQAPRNRR